MKTIPPKSRVRAPTNRPKWAIRFGPILLAIWRVSPKKNPMNMSTRKVPRPNNRPGTGAR